MTTRHAAAMAALAVIISALSAPIFGEPRSYAAKAEFKRLNPCPETGKPRGKCPGWEIDHVVPLKCKGDDLPSNMQWLTVADHKEKTRREAPLCLKPSKGSRHAQQLP